MLSVTDGTGKKISETDTAHIGNQNPFRYRGAYGYYYDVETGFYLAGVRYYDPEIGRWISPESNVYQGDFDDGAGLTAYNVYAYCANDPVNYADPTGEFIITALIEGDVAALIDENGNLAVEIYCGFYNN